MSTYIEVLPPSKSEPNRGMTWEPSATTPNAGRLTITSKRSRTVYAVVCYPTAWTGSAFRLRKVEGGTDPNESAYDVFVGYQNDQDSHCTCKGYSRFGHCKHLSACRDGLVFNGWCPAALVNPETDTANTEAPF